MQINIPQNAGDNMTQNADRPSHNWLICKWRLRVGNFFEGLGKKSSSGYINSWVSQE